MRQRAIAAIFTVGWLGAAAAAPGQATGYIDTVEVQLVVVDVVATTKGGEPIFDLKREDFTIYEDGERVEISQFSRPRSLAERSQGDGGTAAELDSPARLVVFIDNLHIGPAGRRRVFEQLWDVLRKGLGPRDEVMVASYTGNVEVALPMTADRSALRRALQEEGQLVARALTASLGEERVLQLIESRHDEMMQGPRPDPCVDLGFIARTHAEQVHGGVLGAISALQGFVNSLAAYSGRKALLHVSDGIPLVAGLEAYRYAIELCDGTGFSKGIPNAVDTAQLGAGKYTRWDPTTAWAELTQFNSSDEWRRLAAEANTYQVSIYALQASGAGVLRRATVDRARTSYETEADAYRNDQDALFLLASETGGEAILDTNNFAPALTAMVEDSRLAYQLAYAPPSPGDGKQHAIRVEVGRPGVELRHRKSYQSKGIHQRVADGVLATIYHGRQNNPLGARLELIEEVKKEGWLASLTIRVSVPIDSLVLLPDGEVRKGLFTVYVAARDGRGFVMPVGQRTIPLTVAASAAASEVPREYIYEIEITVRGRRHELAVAVRDEVGGEASFLFQTVDLEEG